MHLWLGHITASCEKHLCSAKGSPFCFQCSLLNEDNELFSRCMKVGSVLKILFFC